MNSDNNGQEDIFVHDRQTGITERASVHSNGTEGNGQSYASRISADGRSVVFYSHASNLVADDNNGIRDIFVHDRQMGTTERVNVHSNGTEGNSSSWNHSISADGRYVAFSSHATNLVNSDNNGQEDIFIHDRQMGATERVSAHSNGTEGNGQSNADWDVAGLISADGRSILFESHASNLVDDDNNGNKDLFVANNPLYETRSHWRVQIGADNDINNQHEFSLKNATANGLGLEADNVLSVDDARAAITAIDHAIDEVNSERSYIGSEQNKLQFTMSNLSSNIQNIEASRSSIEDADFAAEAADLAKNQILAQSATAMLAQASAISQNVLGLLS